MSFEMSKFVRVPIAALGLLLMMFFKTASAAPACTVSVGPMSFGVYDPLSIVPSDTTTVVAINCAIVSQSDSGRVNYTVTANSGPGSFADRWLVSGANRISYNLYVTAAISPSAIWGDGAAGTRTVTGSLGPLNRNNPSESTSFTIYGRIPARQDVPTGVYSANVLVTINF